MPVLSIVLTLLVGCASPSVTEPTPQLAARSGAKADSASCDTPALKWGSPEEWPTFYGTLDIALSPSGDVGFFGERYQGHFFRTSDGVVTESVRGRTAVGPDFTTTAAVDFDGNVVISRAGTDPVTIPGPTDEAGASAVWPLGLVFDETGEVLYSLECKGHGEDASARVRKIALTYENAVTTLELGPEVCGFRWNESNELEAIPGRDAVLVTAVETVILADFAAGNTLSSEAIPAVAMDVRMPYVDDAGVLDLAVTPDGSAVAVSHGDGFVRFLDTEHLSPIAAPIESGAFVANPWTYGPSVESPLTWSADGSRLAFVTRDGHVAIGEVESRTITTQIDVKIVLSGRPRPDWLPGEDADLQHPTPSGLAFVGDDLIIATDIGLFLFGCE